MPLSRLTFIGLFTIILGGLAAPCRADNVPNESKALAHYIMAAVHDLNGDAPGAIAEYQQSLRYDNQVVSVNLKLGGYYARLGRLDEAVKYLHKASRLPGEHPQANYLLALVYSSQKKFDLAAREYENILKDASFNQPDNIEVRMYLAQLYYSQEKNAQAIEQFQQILRIQPNNVDAQYLLGVLYHESQQEAKAKEAYRRVLVLNPKHDGALNSLSYILGTEGVSLNEALKMARQAIAIDPSNGAYYDTLGWVLFKKGMNAESLMALQKAENFLQDPIIYDHMGDVYCAVSEFALARKYWKKSLELNPKQAHILKKLGSLEQKHVQSPILELTPSF